MECDMIQNYKSPISFWANQKYELVVEINKERGRGVDFMIGVGLTNFGFLCALR